jgi:Uma2 family endonuclease
MSVMAVIHRHSELPDDPYDLWMRDELADILDLPHDGTRAEIIGGEIVVAPGPKLAHSLIVSAVHRAIVVAEANDPGFRWLCVQVQDLNLSDIHDGYIPDLCVMDKDVAEQGRLADVHKLLPYQLALAVEVTSPSTAAEDRRPGPRRARPSKWNGYARVGIEYYLIVDRDPKIATSTLYINPNRESGSYQESMAWKFGETITLPEPFGVSIRTDEWTPWG